MSAPEPFGVRLAAAISERGPVCVGIDPHPSLLSQWHVDDDGPGLERFGRAVVAAARGCAAAIKPQSALFERHGSRGIHALACVLQAARDAGLVTILDVKRGDIGSTMEAYAQAYLADGAELAADAITASPYLGFASLNPALDLAEATGRGVFVLALTSNPSGPDVQHARDVSGRSVAAEIARQATERNRRTEGPGSIGLVVGATIGTGAVDAGLDLADFHGPILAPGFGAQGAGPEQITQVFGEARPSVLVASSRDILLKGPNIEDMRSAIVHMGTQLRATP
jgi:orotidine-5'-phosphate decarboxylase